MTLNDWRKWCSHLSADHRQRKISVYNRRGHRRKLWFYKESDVEAIEAARQKPADSCVEDEEGRWFPGSVATRRFDVPLGYLYECLNHNCAKLGRPLRAKRVWLRLEHRKRPVFRTWAWHEDDLKPIAGPNAVKAATRPTKAVEVRDDAGLDRAIEVTRSGRRLPAGVSSRAGRHSTGKRSNLRGRGRLPQEVCRNGPAPRICRLAGTMPGTPKFRNPKTSRTTEHAT